MTFADLITEAKENCQRASLLAGCERALSLPPCLGDSFIEKNDTHQSLNKEARKSSCNKGNAEKSM